MTVQETVSAGLQYVPNFFRAFHSMIGYAPCYRHARFGSLQILSHCSLCDSFFILYMLAAAAQHMKSIATRCQVFANIVWDLHMSELGWCLAVFLPVVVMASLLNLAQQVKFGMVFIICAAIGLRYILDERREKRLNF